MHFWVYIWYTFIYVRIPSLSTIYGLSTLGMFCWFGLWFSVFSFWFLFLVFDLSWFWYWYWLLPYMVHNTMHGFDLDLLTNIEVCMVDIIISITY